MESPKKKSSTASLFEEIRKEEEAKKKQEEAKKKKSSTASLFEEIRKENEIKISPSFETQQNAGGTANKNNLFLSEDPNVVKNQPETQQQGYTDYNLEPSLSDNASSSFQMNQARTMARFEENYNNSVLETQKPTKDLDIKTAKLSLSNDIKRDLELQKSNFDYKDPYVYKFSSESSPKVVEKLKQLDVNITKKVEEIIKTDENILSKIELTTKEYSEKGKAINEEIEKISKELSTRKPGSIEYIETESRLKEKKKQLEQLKGGVINSYNEKILSSGDLEAKVNDFVYEEFKNVGIVPEIPFDTEKDLKDLLKSKKYLQADSEEKSLFLYHYYNTHKSSLKGQSVEDFLKDWNFTRTPSITPVIIKSIANEQLKVINNYWNNNIDKLQTRDVRSEADNPYSEAGMLVLDAKRYWEEILKSPYESEIGFFGGVSRSSLTDYLPGISGVESLLRSQRIKSVFDKIEKGQKLTDEERLVYESFSSLNSFAQNSRTSFWYDLGKEALPGMVAFAGEMAATAGSGTAVKSAVSSGIKRAMGEGVSNMLVKAGANPALWDNVAVNAFSSSIALVAKTGLARTPEALDVAVQKMTPASELYFETGSNKFINQVYSFTKDSPSEAIFKAYLLQASEVGTEAIGGDIDKVFGWVFGRTKEISKEAAKRTAVALGISEESLSKMRELYSNSQFRDYLDRMVLGNLSSKYDFLNPKSFNPSLAQEFFKAANINSIWGEIGEEIINNRIVPIIEGTEDPFFKNPAETLKKEVFETGVAMSPFYIFGVGSNLTSSIANKLSKIDKEDYKSFDYLKSKLDVISNEDFIKEKEELLKTADNFKNIGVRISSLSIIKERENFINNNIEDKSFLEYYTDKLKDNEIARNIAKSIKSGEFSSFEEVKDKIDSLKYEDNKNTIKELFGIYERFSLDEVKSNEYSSFSSYMEQNESKLISVANNIEKGVFNKEDVIKEIESIDVTNEAKKVVLDILEQRNEEIERKKIQFFEVGKDKDSTRVKNVRLGDYSLSVQKDNSVLFSSKNKDFERYSSLLEIEEKTDSDKEEIFNIEKRIGENVTNSIRESLSSVFSIKDLNGFLDIVNRSNIPDSIKRDSLKDFEKRFNYINNSNWNSENDIESDISEIVNFRNNKQSQLSSKEIKDAIFRKISNYISQNRSDDAIISVLRAANTLDVNDVFSEEYISEVKNFIKSSPVLLGVDIEQIPSVFKDFFLFKDENIEDYEDVKSIDISDFDFVLDFDNWKKTKKIQSFIRRLNKVFPEIKVSLIETDKDILGYTQDGVVYINKSKVNSSTLIHEFGHLVLDIFKTRNKSAYAKIIENVKNTEDFNEYLESNKNIENIEEEFLVDLISKKGDFYYKKYFESGISGKIRYIVDSIKFFFNNSFKKFGIEDATETDIDTFVDLASSYILKNRYEKIYPAELTDEELFSSKKFSKTGQNLNKDIESFKDWINEKKGLLHIFNYQDVINEFQSVYDRLIKEGEKKKDAINYINEVYVSFKDSFVANAFGKNTEERFSSYDVNSIIYDRKRKNINNISKDIKRLYELYTRIKIVDFKSEFNTGGKDIDKLSNPLEAKDFLKDYSNKLKEGGLSDVKVGLALKNVFDAWKSNYIKSYNKISPAFVSKREIDFLSKTSARKTVDQYLKDVDFIVKITENIKFRKLLTDIKSERTKAYKRSVSFKNKDTDFSKYIKSISLFDFSLLNNNETELKKYLSDLLIKNPYPTTVFSSSSVVEYLKTRSEYYEGISKKENVLTVSKTEDELKVSAKAKVYKDFIEIARSKINLPTKTSSEIKSFLSLDVSNLDLKDLKRYVKFLSYFNSSSFKLDKGINKETYNFLKRLQADEIVSRIESSYNKKYFEILNKKTSRSLFRDFVSIRGSIGMYSLKQVLNLLDGESLYGGEIVKDLISPLEENGKKLYNVMKSINSEVMPEKYGLSNTDLEVIGIYKILKQEPPVRVTQSVVSFVNNYNESIEKDLSLTESEKEDLFIPTDNMYIGQFVDKIENERLFNLLLSEGRKDMIDSILLSYGQSPKYTKMTDNEIEEAQKNMHLVSGKSSATTKRNLKRILNKLKIDNLESYLDDILNESDSSVYDSFPDNYKKWIEKVGSIFKNIEKGEYSDNTSLQFNSYVNGGDFISVENYFPIVRYASIYSLVDGIMSEKEDSSLPDSIHGLLSESRLQSSIYSDLTLRNAFTKQRKKVIQPLKTNAFEAFSIRSSQEIFYLLNNKELKIIQRVLSSDFFKTELSSNSRNLISNLFKYYFNRGITQAKVAVKTDDLEFGISAQRVQSGMNNLKLLFLGSTILAPAQLSSIVNSMQTMKGVSPSKRVANVNWAIQKHLSAASNSEKTIIDDFIENYAPEIFYRGLTDFEITEKTNDGYFNSVLSLFKNKAYKEEFLSDKIRRITSAGDSAKIQLAGIIYFDRMAARISFLANYKYEVEKRGEVVNFKKPNKEALESAMQSIRDTQASESLLSKPAVLAGVSNKGKERTTATQELFANSLWSFKSFAIVDHVKIRGALKELFNSFTERNTEKFKDSSQELVYNFLSKFLFHYTKYLLTLPLMKLAMIASGEDDEDELYKKVLDPLNVAIKSMFEYLFIIEPFGYLFVDLLQYGESTVKGRKLSYSEKLKYPNKFSYVGFAEEVPLIFNDVLGDIERQVLTGEEREKLPYSIARLFILTMGVGAGRVFPGASDALKFLNNVNKVKKGTNKEPGDLTGGSL